MLDVFDSDASTHSRENFNSINSDHISMATEVECTSSPRLSESSKLVEHDDESDGLVDSGDVPPSMSAKK